MDLGPTTSSSQNISLEALINRGKTVVGIDQDRTW
jgi:hypothetical protein